MGGYKETFDLICRPYLQVNNQKRNLTSLQSYAGYLVTVLISHDQEILNCLLSPGQDIMATFKLNGGGGPQVGEVTRLDGVIRLFI